MTQHDTQLADALQPQAARHPMDPDDQPAAPIREVEWGGYIIGDSFGSNRTHPAFRALASPPRGYRFLSRPRPPAPVGAAFLAALIRSLTPDRPAPLTGSAFLDSALREMHTVIRTAVGYGATLHDAHEFFTAHGRPGHETLIGNLQLPRGSGLVLVPTLPWVIGAVPWMVEIEDVTNLFYPYMESGKTRDVGVERLACYPLLRALLEADSCRGIITHVGATARALPRLFQSPALARRVHHIPLGRPAPDLAGKRPFDPQGAVHLLFTNSWHQDPRSFFLRGGRELLDAFAVLGERFPNIHLTLRTGLPALGARHAALVRSHPRIRVLDTFMTDAQLHALMLGSDIYVLPAARLHVVSIIEALGYALPVVASDGWGLQEYVEDGVNGMIVPGRWGVVSWEDPANGMMREDYSPLTDPEGTSPQVVEGLIDRLARLLSDARLYRRLSDNARAAAETRYTLEKWNAGLGAVLDALPPSPKGLPRDDDPNTDPRVEERLLQGAYLRLELSRLSAKRIVCYGAGADLAAMLEQGVFAGHEIVGVLDDARPPGSSVGGHRVVHPSDLAALRPNMIVITSSGYRNVLRERAVGMTAALRLETIVLANPPC